MKRMKKIASLLLAVIMVLGMSVTAFAAESKDPLDTPAGSGDFAITLKGVAKDNHTFNAYQVFTGDLSQSGIKPDGTYENKTLSNIKWGSSIKDENNLIDALKAMALDDKKLPFKDVKSAADVAGVLSEKIRDSEIARKFADLVSSKDASGNFLYLENAAATVNKDVEKAVKKEVEGNKTTYTYTISGLKAGYYLVQESGSNPGNDDAYTRNMLEVVSNVTAKVKAEIPTIDKKVAAENEMTDMNTAGVGNVVFYEIKGKVPDMTDYNYYFYVINDTLSKGLTFNKDSVVVTVDGNEVYPTPEGKTAKIAVYTEEKDDAGNTSFKVAFLDILKDFADKAEKEIVVRYSATVNSEAITVDKATNTATLTYSNDPNHEYDGDKDHENGKPGVPDSTKKVPTGETEKEQTVTFVAKIDIIKTFSDSANLNPKNLPKATFNLTGSSTQYVLKGGEYYEEDANGAYYLLKNGQYTKKAPTTQSYMEDSTSSTAGYVKAEEGYKGHDTVAAKESNSPDAEVRIYRPYNKENDKAAEVYRLVIQNDDEYVSTTVRYKKVEKTEIVDDKTVTTNINMVGTTDGKGKLTFGSLGVGDYTLEETGVPAGYNKAATIKFKIECTLPSTIDGDATWVVKDEKGNVITNAIINGNTYEATILNQKGSLLPSTGGIGTTIFYVVGGILVIGAGILLVAKKRMGNR